MNAALLLSGGTGSRLSPDMPKQYIPVAGKMIVTRCLETLLRHPELDAVQIVAAEEWRGAIRAELSDSAKLKGFSAPGATRQLSILNGLRDLARFTAADDVVLVHDAVRPQASTALISAVLAAAREHDGAMPVLPMTDTVYYGDGTRVERLLERERIYAGQAPEAFRFGKYLRANEDLLPDKILSVRGSSEPAVMAGLDVALIPGEAGNFKITTAEDLERYRKLTE